MTAPEKLNLPVKVTYIFTHPIRWVPFELVAKYIDKSKFAIDYIILNESDPMISYLQDLNIPCTVTSYPDYSNTPEMVKFLYDHLLKNQTDIVHTHWFAGSLAGMQAAYYAKVPVRIFTREHPSIKYYARHAASKHRLIWECATNVIGVTNKSKEGMIEDGIPEHKITLIPTGFDVSEYENVETSRIEKLRAKYLGNHQGPVIGVAARYVRWKGVEYVIEAYKKVLDIYPNALLVLAGTGIDRTDLQEKIRKAHKEDIVSPQYDDILSISEKLSQLPKQSYIEIPFETDLFALFKLFTVFVHAPTDSIQETFGQVYVDAMLSRVPSVITLGGSAADHAVHQENAWVVDYKNSDQISEGILALLSDTHLREKIINNAFLCAQQYDIKNHIQRLEQFYISELSQDKKLQK
ncbi:glycosyltransferase family 4 protein [Phormidium tenue]|jgi:glycosyltransferase involved in cell wall biosynthesis|uniref:Glycosyltransferase family 4 protein n=1 Tax=Phormidium tenue FACHB-1050 TaxID=2692857 RepID=A0ABR8CIB7_9CYAN|nr:glycosyltransferase family 4 protein [Phormidium tenue]MBD2319427.1 glycosyltransferase family 4 protein [Phormidium tenue FACHB-1050]